MSKVKLLLEVISSMRALADDLDVLAQAMASGKVIGSDANVTVKDESKDTASENISDPKPAKKYTIADVRGVLAKKATSDAKSILTELGYEKLSEVPEDKYPQVLEKAEVIPDA